MVHKEAGESSWMQIRQKPNVQTKTRFCWLDVLFTSCTGRKDVYNGCFSTLGWSINKDLFLYKILGDAGQRACSCGHVTWIKSRRYKRKKKKQPSTQNTIIGLSRIYYRRTDPQQMEKETMNPEVLVGRRPCRPSPWRHFSLCSPTPLTPPPRPTPTTFVITPYQQQQRLFSSGAALPQCS